MTRRSNLRFALLSLPAGRLFAADKVAPFKPGPAGSYPAHQKLEDVTIGIKPYETAELCKEVFGKLNPLQYEVLPVLVVIENGRKNALRVDRLQVEYVIPGAGKLEHTPLPDLRTVVGPTAPKPGPNPLPIPRPNKVKKNPFNVPEVEERAWSAKMIGPGETAHGFFFFQTRHRTSARLYLTGLFEPATGKELFYYEVPFTA